VSITSCEIPDIIDNRRCRFWYIFTAVVILCMRRHRMPFRLAKNKIAKLIKQQILL